jgi:transposase
MSEEVGEVSTYDLVDTKRGAARRRRWPEALRRQIVAETRLLGASVSMVARRHDVNANQVFKWRRQYEAVAAGKDEARLVPVAVRPLPASVLVEDRDPPRPASVIEIELKTGARVRISGAVDGGALRQVLDLLR